jgi:multiple sugar transport system ATP-binding protein
MADVKLKNIMKSYGSEYVAVRDFNLEIADKEFVVLVGPSGCGKSTTLRMIAGLEDITEGELYIGGNLVNDVPPKDRDIAMVFQSYALYPHLTVYENMAFALKIRKMNKKEIDERVMRAAGILGIEELLARKPKALSGGQRQRVAIGRAIVREPRVFLMDEPLSNLDAKLRNQMRSEIIKLRKRIDTTFIYVTHDQTEAMTLGDRIVIMKDGLIQQTGTPKDVFLHPVNVFVAGFIGSPQMNFFKAELENANGNYSVRLDKSVIRLPDGAQRTLRENGERRREIILGVRPEHIILTNRDDPAGVTAQVEVSEMMGSEIYLHVTVNDVNAVIRVALVDLPADKNDGFSVGDKINFAFAGGLAHLFDPETEITLAR